MQYSSELGVKIVSDESKNLVKDNKDVNREVYIKFANKNFKEDLEDDDDDDSSNNDDESQPVLPRDDQLGGQIVWQDSSQ